MGGGGAGGGGGVPGAFPDPQKPKTAWWGDAGVLRDMGTGDIWKTKVRVTPGNIVFYWTHTHTCTDTFCT